MLRQGNEPVAAEDFPAGLGGQQRHELLGPPPQPGRLPDAQRLPDRGVEFRGDARAALIDLNGDGTVDVRDATAFGNHWNGKPPATRKWSNTALPAKP